MRRELIKSLRTVALLAMFSQDQVTVSNIQSCMKSMCLMEPDLILHPILERAIPSLEALVETQRTMAVIKALGAIAPSIVCRDVYYAGAKHLVPILELLIPGIDLNDPAKTVRIFLCCCVSSTRLIVYHQLCTTAFLHEISQYIKFGDLTIGEGESPVINDYELPNSPKTATIPSLKGMLLPSLSDEPEVSIDEEDKLLRVSYLMTSGKIITK
jgi:proteasome activator subunit 4